MIGNRGLSTRVVRPNRNVVIDATINFEPVFAVIGRSNDNPGTVKSNRGITAGERAVKGATSCLTKSGR